MIHNNQGKRAVLLSDVPLMVYHHDGLSKRWMEGAIEGEEAIHDRWKPVISPSPETCHYSTPFIPWMLSSHHQTPKALLSCVVHRTARLIAKYTYLADHTDERCSHSAPLRCSDPHSLRCLTVFFLPYNTAGEIWMKVAISSAEVKLFLVEYLWYFW